MLPCVLTFLGAGLVTVVPDQFAEVDLAVAAALKRGDCPGAVVIVVHADEVVFRNVGDDNARVLQLASGDVQMATDVPVNQVDQVQGQGDPIETVAGSAVGFITLNEKVKPLDEASSWIEELRRSDPRPYTNRSSPDSTSAGVASAEERNFNSRSDGATFFDAAIRPAENTAGVCK